MECIKKRGRSLGVDRKPQGGQKFLSQFMHMPFDTELPNL